MSLGSFFKDFGNAIISGGTSLIGDVIGGFSNKASNETNMKINQMNNEFNERMLEKQQVFNSEEAQKARDYTTEMWNKTNEYNSASAQMSRYKEAGLNGALMMSGAGNAGIASAGTTTQAQSGSASAASPLGRQPFHPNFQGAASAITQALDVASQIKSRTTENKYKEAITDNVKIENQYKAQKLMSEIWERVENARNKKEQAQYQKIYNNYADDMLQGQLSAQALQNSYRVQEIQGVAIQNAIQDYRLQMLPERTRLELAGMGADIALKMATKQLTETQAYTEYQRYLNEILKMDNIQASTKQIQAETDYTTERTKSLKLDFKTRDALFYATVMQGYVELVNSGLDLTRKTIDLVNPFSYFSGSD